jgi:hypothetical protein
MSGPPKPLDLVTFEVMPLVVYADAGDGYRYQIPWTDQDIIGGSLRRYAITAYIAPGSYVPNAWRAMGYRAGRVSIVSYAHTYAEAATTRNTFTNTHRRSPAWVPMPIILAKPVTDA